MGVTVAGGNSEFLKDTFCSLGCEIGDLRLEGGTVRRGCFHNAEAECFDRTQWIMPGSFFKCARELGSVGI
jgi:hypothetical protein